MYQKALISLTKISFKLKQVSLILNVILLVAVAFLYFKVYSKEEPVVVTGPAASSKVVFVNSDSLMDNYSFFNELQDRMEKKKDSLDRMLTARGSALEKEVQDYQQKAAGMSDGERQLREEALLRKQQGLMQERDNLLDKLKEEEAALTDSIHNDLMTYLKEFNKSNKFDFILGYSRGGGILFANDSLDITKKVIEGINKK